MLQKMKRQDTDLSPVPENRLLNLSMQQNDFTPSGAQTDNNKRRSDR